MLIICTLTPFDGTLNISPSNLNEILLFDATFLTRILPICKSLCSKLNCSSATANPKTI